MHADVAGTHIFRELKKMKDYKLDWLKKALKKVIENKADAATIPPLRDLY